MSESEFLCLYLDDHDFCEEIEVENEHQGSRSQPSTSTKAGHKRGKSTTAGAAMGGSKRKRKMLNKEEKAQVMLSICDVDVDDVLSHVKEAVGGELHITALVMTSGQAYRAQESSY